MDAPLFREDVPILRTKTYLNTCSLGPLTRQAKMRVDQFYREWATFGAPAWYKIWWERLQETRATFAGLIGARPEEVAVLPNVSAALSVIASSLDYKTRPNVVTTRIDFPTIPYVWMARPDAHVRRVGSRRDLLVPKAKVTAALDDSVAALATTHVVYSTGGLQDIRALSAAARRAGAVSIIDSYHGVGQVPVDVKEVGCDILISGGLKWLLGGPGCALMYVRGPLLRRLEPTITGWFANAEQFQFDPEVFTFRPTAARFELGTPSLPSTFATLGGMELVRRAQPAAIRRRQNHIVTDLYEKLRDAGFAIRSPPEEKDRAGILMVPVADPPGVVARLAKRRIVIDHRDGKIRVSPYFYNSGADIDKFVGALKAIAKAGAR